MLNEINFVPHWIKGRIWRVALEDPNAEWWRRESEFLFSNRNEIWSSFRTTKVPKSSGPCRNWTAYEQKLNGVVFGSVCLVMRCSVRFGSVRRRRRLPVRVCRVIHLNWFRSRHTHNYGEWTDEHQHSCLYTELLLIVDIVETCSEKYRNSASASCHKHRFNVRVNVWGVISTSQSKFLCR